MTYGTLLVFFIVRHIDYAMSISTWLVIRENKRNHWISEIRIDVRKF